MKTQKKIVTAIADVKEMPTFASAIERESLARENKKMVR